MSFADKLKAKYKESLVYFADPSFATTEIANNRMGICQACPEFIPLTKRCTQCGCFMNLKTKLAAASCPLEKW